MDKARRHPPSHLHPLRAVLLAGTFPLFLGALLSDWAYTSTYQVQWANFASWLIAGGLVFAGVAMVWALVSALRAGRRGPGRWLHLALQAAAFAAGFINALVHARDSWASMPAGIILSAAALILAVASIWTAYSAGGQGGTR